MEKISRHRPSVSSGKGWEAFTRQLAKDSQLWLWVIALLLISRAILIGSNRASFATDLSFSDYVKVFFTGFRFDMPVATLIVAFVLLCILTLGLRGSWGRRPMQMKDAARTEDFLLNRCVINPLISLVYAIKAHRALMHSISWWRICKGNTLPKK